WGEELKWAGGGRCRGGLFGFSRAKKGGTAKKPHQPHYQSRDYNPLNGDIERWFEPVKPEIATHPALRAILDTCYRLFHGLTPTATRPASWHVETHQFRIEAIAGAAGQPTP